MVVGTRSRDSHAPLSRRPGKFVMTRFADFLAGVRIPDVNSGLRAFKRDAATGRQIWINDTCGIRYMARPHQTTMGGVAPLLGAAAGLAFFFSAGEAFTRFWYDQPFVPWTDLAYIPAIADMVFHVETGAAVTLGVVMVVVAVIGLAIALLKDAPNILLDEPLEALDRRIRSEVLAWIGRRTAARATVVVVSHAIEPFLDIATHAVGMRQGRPRIVAPLPDSRAEATITFGRVSAFRLDVNERWILQTDALQVNTELVRRGLAKLGKPVERDQFASSEATLPIIINAAYDPSWNGIEIPAAFLQPPFYDPKADPAVNYCTMGAVIGHELTHGFDDQGRKYDADGNLTRAGVVPADGRPNPSRLPTVCIRRNPGGNTVGSGP